MAIDEEILQAIAVTFELTGTMLSEAATRVFANDLEKYPKAQILGALSRCRKEVRGRLTLQDVIGRLDDGRPGPEQAWSMIPREESESVVWTDEMAQAWGIAQPLLLDGDQVAARMAFLENYRASVMQARDAGITAHWFPSLGHDKNGREHVLMDAVEKGRLKPEHALSLLPHQDMPSAQVAQLIERVAKRLVNNESSPKTDEARAEMEAKRAASIARAQAESER